LVARTPIVFRGVISESLLRRGYHVHALDTVRLDIGDRFILDGEAFPAGRYQLSLGPKLRFVVP
jgi:diacylglycerol kinase (ATP)